MTYKMFLDDERSVYAIYPNAKFDEFVIARSFDEAKFFIHKLGIPYFISFDNDLGEGQKEGYDFAKELVEIDMESDWEGNGFPSNFSFHVHSANCKAWENISSYLNNYLKFKAANSGFQYSDLTKPEGN